MDILELVKKENELYRSDYNIVDQFNMVKHIMVGWEKSGSFLEKKEEIQDKIGCFVTVKYVILFSCKKRGYRIILTDNYSEERNMRYPYTCKKISSVFKKINSYKKNISKIENYGKFVFEKSCSYRVMVDLINELENEYVL